MTTASSKTPVSSIIFQEQNSIASNPYGLVLSSQNEQMIRICGSGTTVPVLNGTANQIQFYCNNSIVSAFDSIGMRISENYPVTLGNSTSYFKILHNGTGTMSTSSSSIVISNVTGTVATLTPTLATFSAPIDVTNQLTINGALSCTTLTCNGPTSCAAITMESTGIITVNGQLETTYTTCSAFVENTFVNVNGVAIAIDQYLYSIM